MLPIPLRLPTRSSRALVHSAAPARSTQALWRSTLTVLCLLTASTAYSAVTPKRGARVTFAQSISSVPPLSAAVTASPGPRRVRDALTIPETEAVMPFEVALRMRSFDEFQTRVARGERVSDTELAEKYLPTEADYAQVRAWLADQGFLVTHDHRSRLALFARGRVKEVTRVFETTFARVAADGAEFTSAVTPPTIPAELAPAVLGIHGLQPHVRLHRMALVPMAVVAPPYLPIHILRAYGGGDLGLRGSGQTIAVLAAAYPQSADIVSFWQTAGVLNTLAHVVPVPVNGGPTASPASDLLMEATLDVQYLSSLAPGATIRVYGFDTTDPVGFDLAFAQVYADLATNPGLHQFSISMGAVETWYARDYLLMFAQSTALLTNAGVTIFASSGDDGNNGTLLHPACDPNVTSVGGTKLTVDSSGYVISETAWTGSGGGASRAFTRPVWQVGSGLTAGSSAMRMVPDVGAIADPAYGVTIIVSGAMHQVGGTSLSTPVWAAFCALINESRATASESSVGNLNPKVYPLLGTQSMRDITAGPYGSVSGYDTFTGVGVPNLPALITALANAGMPPVCAAQSKDAPVTPGQPAAFSVVMEGDAPLAYRWERQAKGQTTWAALPEGSTYVGTTGPTLVVAASDYSANGDLFRCVATNAYGSGTSAPSTLIVSGCGVTTMAGWPGKVGSDDGVGRLARFGYPGSVRVDPNGNVIVADGGNQLIRRITPNGQVTTIAGIPGQSGSTDGAAAAATFHNPGGVAIDAAGNIYVADCENYTVRKITPGGVVSTLAGRAGYSGSTDGNGGNARFADPQNIASDAAGNLYVADGTGCTIRKITPAGDVTTIAGSAGIAGTTDGTGANARFAKPIGLTVDATGNVYVADATNNNVRKITPDGTVSTLPGTFAYAGGVAVDPTGNVYVAAGQDNTVRLITPSGVVSVIAGISGSYEAFDGPTQSFSAAAKYYPAAQFHHPIDLAIDPNTLGVLYVADAYNCTVRRIVLGATTLGAYAAPGIAKYPASKTVLSGQDATFSLTATGTELLAYQWQRQDGASYTNLSDDATYGGTRTATLTIKSPSVTMNGTRYVCVVSNNFGAQSPDATLYVNGSPVVTGPSTSIGVRLGGSVTLTAPIGGSIAAYQWSLNGVPLVGRNGSLLTIYSVTTADLGTYTVTATNSYGQVTTTVATLSLGSSRLINLSSRATAASDFDSLFVGCSTGGSGSKTLLVRGAGPSLVPYPFSVADAVPEPELILYDQKSVELDRNAGWASTDELSQMMSRVGAFPFASGSKDCALVRTLPVGSFSAQISGKTAPGTALAEIYDTDSYDAPARLINLSARANIGPGGTLIGGFVIQGNVDKKVLIRGIGPTLRQAPFNIPTAMPAVLLTVIRASDHAEIGRNSVWGGTQDLINTFNALGAFGLPSDSKDAACLLTLSPGLYTAVLQSPTDQSLTGIAMIEIYDASP